MLFKTKIPFFLKRKKNQFISRNLSYFSLLGLTCNFFFSLPTLLLVAGCLARLRPSGDDHAETTKRRRHDQAATTTAPVNVHSSASVASKTHNISRIYDELHSAAPCCSPIQADLTWLNGLCYLAGGFFFPSRSFFKYN